MEICCTLRISIVDVVYREIQKNFVGLQKTSMYKKIITIKNILPILNKKL